MRILIGSLLALAFGLFAIAVLAFGGLVYRVRRDRKMGIQPTGPFYLTWVALEPTPSDIQGITLDGDDRLVPEALRLEFPAFLGDMRVLSGHEKDPAMPWESIRKALRGSSVCCLQIFNETKLFTSDARLHEQLKNRLEEWMG